MSNFSIGQEIICIKNHSQGVVTKGSKYIIKAILKYCKCRHFLLDLGLAVKNKGQPGNCSKCNKKFVTGNNHLVADYLFAPIDNDLSELSLENILEELQPKTLILTK